MTLRAHITQCAGQKLWAEDSAGRATVQCDYTLPVESEIFAGHFPHNPILPAVVQCLMVQMLAEMLIEKESVAVSQERTQENSPYFHIDDAKFTAPIIPPCTVTVQVQRGRKEGLFVGNVRVGEQLHAKISLLFGVA